MEEIIEYHRANEGISRYRKFRHFHENILGLEYTEKAGLKLGKEFSALAYGKVLDAPFVKGASAFLEKYHAEYLMYIASGTPAEELESIVRARGISGYFRGVYGSPTLKAEALRDMMERHGLSGEEAVFVGDAGSDRDAAREAGTHFIARVIGSGGALKDERNKIEDLEGLMGLIGALGR